MDSLLLITLVGAIMGMASFVAITVSRKQEKRKRFIAAITQGRTGVFTGESRDRNLARQRADSIARKLKSAGKEAGAKKDKTTIRMLMMHAGYDSTMTRYWLYSAGFAFLVWALLSLMTKWPQPAVLMTVFAAMFGAPKMFLKRKAARRQRKFLEEFADALDASVRLLQAGMPISEAVAMVAREYTGPLRDEMTRMYENQKIGMSLGGAALEMARRIPLPEVHMFATALQIQSETGSSLSEVLSNLSAVIRARYRLKRKVKALSSEAKASAAIIAALPILVSLGLYFVNESYIRVLFDTARGNIFLGIAIGWMTCGVLIMRQMINFKI